MTGPWVALMVYGAIALGTLALVPILLIIMMIPVGVIGIIHSMHERKKWN